MMNAIRVINETKDGKFEVHERLRTGFVGNKNYSYKMLGSFDTREEADKLLKAM